MRVHIEQWFQQGVAIRNREEQKSKDDRDRTAQIAGDQQPACDQLEKRDPDAEKPQQELRNPGVLIGFDEKLASVRFRRHDEHLVHARHSE